METEVRDKPPSEKRQVRQDQALPVLGEFRSWLDQALRAAVPCSPTASAIGYMPQNWTAISRYTESGILAIDNNACERPIRPVALGRK